MDASPPDDDRPTPTDDLSSTSPPDTSRTSTAQIEEAALDPGATARYAAADQPWTNTSARRRAPTVQNPSMAEMAAAADAAVAADTKTRPNEAARAAGEVVEARGRGRSAPAASPSSKGSTPAPATSAVAAPMCAFRVAVQPVEGGGVRVTVLAPGARVPAGAATAMLVATSEAESTALAELFGYTG
ncbi:MAG: hypothetical protein R3B70_32115 [Polyangiaceae bacterium]